MLNKSYFVGLIYCYCSIDVFLITYHMHWRNSIQGRIYVRIFMDIIRNSYLIIKIHESFNNTNIISYYNNNSYILYLLDILKTNQFFII